MAGEKSVGRPGHRKLKIQWVKVAVVKVTGKKNPILSLSIPLRFLSLSIYCTNTSFDKQLKTSHIIGKNDGKSIPVARQILTVVMTTDGIVHVYIYLNGWGTHATVNWTQPGLQSLTSRLFPKSVNQDCEGDIYITVELLSLSQTSHR